MKMLGQEDMDPTATSEDPRSFNRKPVWARACVISAGVVMNLIFGMIFLIVAFKAGVELPPAEVKFSRTNKYVLLAVGVVIAACVAAPLFALVYPPALIRRESRD